MSTGAFGRLLPVATGSNGSIGRDIQDVLTTIEVLAARSIHVRSLDLDGVDLTSAAGKLQPTVLAAVAAFECDRIKERTKEGLARTTKKGG